MTPCVSENPGDGGQAGAAEAPAEGARGKGKRTGSAETSDLRYRQVALISALKPRLPVPPILPRNPRPSREWGRRVRNPFQCRGKGWFKYLQKRLKR